MIRAFIQARMGSKRFPGKVLAPLKGKPVIAHLIARVAWVLPTDQITVATSAEPSDDPLDCYVREMGISVHRGSLDNVLGRFQSCLRAYPCEWFFRLCADSPFLDSFLLQAMMKYSEHREVDLITNVFPRSFPRGQSAELLRAATFAAIEAGELSAEEREHVTRVYYHHPDRFRIVNIESAQAGQAAQSFAVDTPEDLHRLEQAILSVPPLGRGSSYRQAGRLT